jgi:NAD(P)-dependent dehydrogenase (short-subunit alcohol dehydrogenase family)
MGGRVSPEYGHRTRVQSQGLTSRRAVDDRMGAAVTMTSLEGRRIIITGGASGMGEGMVRAFPALGAKVASLDLNQATGEPIASASGADFFAVDVSDKGSVDSAFAAAVARLDGLDVLVHAAGIAPACPSDSTPVGLWNDIMRVNATGTMLANQAAVHYLKTGGGAILNFASAAGVQGLPNKAAYAASKGAVLAGTRTRSKGVGFLSDNGQCHSSWDLDGDV